MHGVDFEHRAGEKLALVGESGSGKTVTALSLLRLVQNARPGIASFAAERAAARATCWSCPSASCRHARASEIAMIFQEPMTALNPLYTVGDQIAEVLQLHRRCRARAAHEAAVRLLADTGIPEPERRARELSRTSSRAASASAR